MKDMSRAENPLLSVSNLILKFGGVTALNDINLQLACKEILGIVGPNGAGKTAIVNCITGFYKVTSGSIHFSDVNITSLPLYKRSRLGIARTFQNIRLFKRMTVLENVVVAEREWIGRPLASLLRASGSKSFRHRGMELLDTFRLTSKADELAGNLSYGEARRLEIARALATNPRLLILDEPSAGMNERESVELIGDIKANIERLGAVIVIEHDIGFICDLSDRVIAIDYGRKIADGSAEEVFNTPAVVEAYLGAAADD
jgi:branched-chain amino acid transport system ATP-binding protein